MPEQRDRPQRPPDPKRPQIVERARWFQLTEASSIGIEMAAAIGVGAFGGIWLERNVTHWSPWTTYLGLGIGLALASLAVMPFLSLWQRRTGRELGSAAVEGDGTQTLLCTYLSAVLLVGLVLNATLGWFWADPVAALIIAAVAAREGWENWQGDDCCTPAALTTPRAVTDVPAVTTHCAEDDCCTPSATELDHDASTKVDRGT